MPTDFEKAKQEQERKRKLWLQRRLEKYSREEYKRRLNPQTPVQALRAASEEIEEENNNTESTSRNPERILARLRAQKLKELRKNRDQKGATAKEEIEKAKNAAQRLRMIYRIINGTAAITLVGLIITFLVMNAQLLFGNLLKLKVIPALSKIEIFIILFINFIIIAILFLIILLICTIVAIMMESPIIKFIADFFNLSI